MGSKGIYDNWRQRRNFEKYGLLRISDAVQTRLADDLSRDKKKDSIVYNFDKNNFNNGKLWFNEEFSLDEAPDYLKDNISFISGYNKAKRDQYVKNLAYQTGIEYRDKGVPFEEIPEIYKNNMFFMNGYNSRDEKTLVK